MRLLTEKLMQAERMLYEGETEHALEFLLVLAKDAEEYINQNYVTTSTKQYFSFDDVVELLAYKKVEDDPREIEVVSDPYDRLYADLALAYMGVNDVESAKNALKQACRWNSMECEHRLRLADLFLYTGNIDEYLGLTFSCFDRALDAPYLIRAYVNFAHYYQKTERPALAAACLKLASRFEVPEPTLQQALVLAQGTDCDPDVLTVDEAQDLLAPEGIPEGANAEIAICLLMCALDAGAADKQKATAYSLKARNLVGAKACQALIELMQESAKDE